MTSSFHDGESKRIKYTDQAYSEAKKGNQKELFDGLLQEAESAAKEDRDPEDEDDSEEEEEDEDEAYVIHQEDMIVSKTVVAF